MERIWAMMEILIPVFLSGVLAGYFANRMVRYRKKLERRLERLKEDARIMVQCVDNYLQARTEILTRRRKYVSCGVTGAGCFLAILGWLEGWEVLIDLTRPETPMVVAAAVTPFIFVWIFARQLRWVSNPKLARSRVKLRRDQLERDARVYGYSDFLEDFDKTFGEYLKDDNDDIPKLPRSWGFVP